MQGRGNSRFVRSGRSNGGRSGRNHNRKTIGQVKDLVPTLTLTLTKWVSNIVTLGADLIKTSTPKSSLVRLAAIRICPQR